MADVRYIPLPPALVGMRCDAALARLLGISRTASANLAQAGKVYIDGVQIGKSDLLFAGQMLQVEMPAPKIAPAPIAVKGIKIVWEDEDIVIVDKPVGVAAHPSVGWDGPTVTGAIASAGVRIATSGAQERQGVVSRLDVGTSGIMLVTKTERGYGIMKAQFKEHAVQKIYHALVQGHPHPARGTVDAPIGRDPKHSWKMCISVRGKEAITHYRTIETLAQATLLEVNLETGRTHQIRVHMSALHHPCVGDPIYGANPVIAQEIDLDRQWLHAHSLRFTHPVTYETVQVQSPAYPEDLAQALEKIRAKRATSNTSSNTSQEKTSIKDLE